MGKDTDPGIMRITRDAYEKALDTRKRCAQLERELEWKQDEIARCNRAHEEANALADLGKRTIDFLVWDSVEDGKRYCPDCGAEEGETHSEKCLVTKFLAAHAEARK